MSALGQLAGRRILFLNWRDLANPAAGGAEAYAEQIARRFARAGALLTLFTSRYEDAAAIRLVERLPRRTRRRPLRRVPGSSTPPEGGTGTGTTRSSTSRTGSRSSPRSGRRPAQPSSA